MQQTPLPGEEQQGKWPGLISKPRTTVGREEMPGHRPYHWCAQDRVPQPPGIRLLPSPTALWVCNIPRPVSNPIICPSDPIPVSQSQIPDPSNSPTPYSQLPGQLLPNAQVTVLQRWGRRWTESAGGKNRGISRQFDPHSDQAVLVVTLIDRWEGQA